MRWKTIDAPMCSHFFIRSYAKSWASVLPVELQPARSSEIARSAFPCIDLPPVKAERRLKIPRVVTRAPPPAIRMVNEGVENLSESPIWMHDCQPPTEAGRCQGVAGRCALTRKLSKGGFCRLCTHPRPPVQTLSY